jgi:beta-galactosidase
MQKDESTRDLNASAGGMERRDALKAVVMLAAAPLAGQTAGTTQVSSARSSAAVENKRGQRFDDGWRFFRADASGAERPDFDDSAWRRLDLPHDWSVEDLPPRPEEASGAGSLWGSDVLPTRVGPFDTELSQGGRDTGWFVGGAGWYRKRFTAGAIPADGRLEIVFDGVYMNSDVWLNGNLLGNHPYGYTSFAYDLTPHLRRAGENVLAVRVRNEGRNSRWYSGSGIYRHVWLNATGGVRVPLWGVHVTTPEVSRDSATVKVAVAMENRAKSAQEVTVRIRLFDSRNAAAGSREARQALAAGASAQVEQTFTIARPELWSLAATRMYHAEVDLLVGGKTSDHAQTPFGIRKIEVDAQRGLRINGEAVKLKGGCLHHDNGLLGAAALDRAEERRVELMKAHGFNAIRTSHNPPSPAFLDACDRLGVLVMDEAFDCWERQKNAQDYHLYFAEWWQRDIDAMVLRDRNHPSVIFWSIGNEIPERAEPRGVEIAKQIVERIKSLDPSRPITAGINGGRGSEGLDAAFQYLDVAGYNYLWGNYESDHARLPNRVILGTESFPQHAFQNWQLVEKHPFVIGDFVWTGMDHLGESSIGNAQLAAPGRGGMGAGAPGGGGPAPQPGAGSGGPQGPAGGAARGGMSNMFSGLASMGNISLGFPWFNCYCGDIDLIGEAKPQWHYRQVVWGTSKLEMAVQRPLPAGRTETISAWGWSDELRSWTWPGYEGRTLKVRLFSTGDQVRLLLNGKEIGVKPVSVQTEMRAEFDVPYAAGELKAVAMSDGSEVAKLVFKTAGKPARLRLRADRPLIRRDRNDLSFVTLEVLDQAGELVPDAALPVAFSIAGAGDLAAVGTANPKDVRSFRTSRPRTFHGKCLAIVRPKGVAGSATLQAHADGLTAASVVIQVS